jgi:hypothetical protein
MPNRPFAESVLGFFAGRTRAAAIYGDLVELAVPRGRLWFCIAYVRTVVALSWRTPVALVLVLISLTYLRGSIVDWFTLLSHPNFTVSGQFVHSAPGHYVFLVSSWLGCILWIRGALWLLLPYIAIRFGLRSRLCYLACALFLVGLPAYFSRPIPYMVSSVMGAAIAASALASPRWRKEMIFVAINSTVAYVVFLIAIARPDPLHIFHYGHGPFPLGLKIIPTRPGYPPVSLRIDEVIILALTFLLCPLLHKWLLGSSDNSMPGNAGAADA